MTAFARQDGPSASEPSDDPLAAQVLRLERRLEERLVLFGAFEHQLKGSFSVLAGWAESLRERWDSLSDSDRRSGVDHIAEKAAEVVDSALALLRDGQTEWATLHPKREPVDVVALARDVVVERRQALGPRVVCVHSDAAVAMTDADAVRLLLGELLDNAVKYTTPHGSIGVRASAWDGTVDLTVDDDGVGVPDDVDVFAAFTRGAGTEDIAGSGMGLYIAGRLARDLGGRLTAQRRPERGSRFTLTLPADHDPRPATNGRAGAPVGELIPGC
jgi:signal transduction histidine kinase